MKSLIDFCSKIVKNSKKPTDIGSLIEEFCNLGIVKFATFHMIVANNNSLAVPFVKTTYPEDWVRYYLLNNLMAVDPVVRIGRYSKAAFRWEDISQSVSEKKMMEEAHDHGLSVSGYTVPTIDVGPYRGIFSMCPDIRCDKQRWAHFINEHQKEIEDIAYALHGAARHAVDPYEDYTINLSRRETECLQYIAVGKTHTEMAAILGISEHTIRSYCRTLRLKLNCSTLAQAVAKACAAGLI